MSDAYIETTVLTDLLLKPLTNKQQRAQAALKRYNSTLLPVYAIKEWKAGPLVNYAYVHNKLVLTKSLAHTTRAISELPQLYKKLTGLDALAAAGEGAKKAAAPLSALGDSDQAMADSYRLALASLALRSWDARRRITTDVVAIYPATSRPLRASAPTASSILNRLSAMPGRNAASPHSSKPAQRSWKRSATPFQKRRIAQKTRNGAPRSNALSSTQRSG